MTACSCRPCGIRCMHDVALRRTLATRVLAQTTGAPNLFQAGAIAWQDQWCAVRLLSTLDILRATWLAGFGTLPSGQVAEASSGRNPRPLLMWSGHVRVRPGVYSRSGKGSARAAQAGDWRREARGRTRPAGAPGVAPSMTSSAVASASTSSMPEPRPRSRVHAGRSPAVLSEFSRHRHGTGNTAHFPTCRVDK